MEKRVPKIRLNVEEPLDRKPRHFKRLLRGSLDHYSAYLAGKFSFFWRMIFRVLFSRIKLSDRDAERIKRLSKRGTIIYVIRNRSRLEYLMLSYFLRKRKLPAPVFAHYISMYLWQSVAETLRRILARFEALIERKGYMSPYESGYVAELFRKREASLLPARHFGGLPWRFSRKKGDPLADIIEIQRQTGIPVILLPVEVAYGQRPDREFTRITDLLWGTKTTPSAFRQVMMFLRNIRNTTIHVSDPISLEEAVDIAMINAPDTPQRDQEIAYNIRTRCIERLNRERRVILGPVLKSKSEWVEQVLHDPNLFAFLQDLSKADEKNFAELRRDAKKMIEEIAADYNPNTVQVMIWILTWAFKKLYAGMEINLDLLDEVRGLAREMPVVYIPCHKSHLDYLLVSYLLYKHQMSLPYIVSGVNLNFWPLGSIFRGGGAFFMRRTFRGKRLYSKVFSKYVEHLITEDIPIEFFFEGTRSRTGKIVMPKLGFLSILLEAVRASGKKNLCIVPIAINYEHIFEKNFYLDEAAGKPKEGENISTMIRHRKLAKQKLGKMYLRLAKPFTLSDLLWESDGKIPADRGELMTLAHKMAIRVAHGINSQSIATPFSIIASVLLSAGRRGIYLSEIYDGVGLLLGYLRAAGVRVVGTEPGWIDDVLAKLEKDKILSTETEDEEEEGEEEDKIYFLDDDKRMDLTIYKNSIVHHYQSLSLLSICFLGAGGPISDEDLFTQFRFLKDLLSSELIFSEKRTRSDEEDRDDFTAALEFFTGHGFVSVTQHDMRVLDNKGQKAARLFAGSTVDFVGSYYIAARTLWKHRKKEMTSKEWSKKAMKKGKRLSSTDEILRQEAVHKNIIENGIAHMVTLGICEKNDTIDEKFRRTITYKVMDFTKLQALLDKLKPYAQL